MRSNLRRTIVVALSAALASLVTFAGLSPVAAYPPGAVLTLVANKTHVSSSETVTFTATYAAPNSSVKFTYGKQTKTVKADAAGVAVVALKTGGTGVWVAKAQNLAATATTTVYAPKVSLTKSSANRGTTNSVKIQYTQPGAVLTLMVGGQAYSGVGAGSSTVTINFVMPAKGRYTILVFINAQQFTSLRVDSK